MLSSHHLEFFIGEVAIEKDRVEVRTIVLITVFARVEETNFLRMEFFAETLHEALEVIFNESSARWKVFGIVGQSDEAIFLIERSFVHTPRSPVCCVL